MDIQYGIAVSNKYQFLNDEEEDPYEILKQQEEAKSKKKDETDKKAKNKHARKVAPPTDAKNKQAETTVTKKEGKSNNKNVMLIIYIRNNKYNPHALQATWQCRMSMLLVGKLVASHVLIATIRFTFYYTNFDVMNSGNML